MIDYEPLRSALKHLEQQFANHQRAGTRPELTEIDREGIAESVIQRFETSFDMCWKTLKRYLSEEIGVADVPSSPKPVLKIAGQNNLLTPTVEKWLEYADARNATAHDYSGEKAEDTLGEVEIFIPDAIALFRTMTGATWE